MITAPVLDVDLTVHDLYRGGFPHDLFRALRDEHPVWRHPRATLTAIEQELDRQWRRVRADLVASLALAGAGEPGACPRCCGPLTRRGQRARTLRTDGDEPIVLQRAYNSFAASGGEHKRAVIVCKCRTNWFCIHSYFHAIGFFTTGGSICFS